MTWEIDLEPLTVAAFEQFGAVIELSKDTDRQTQAMNDARFRRFDSLATTDIDPGSNAIISIAECLQASTLPYDITLLERHPRGTQAFIPLQGQPMIIVVAEPGTAPGAEPSAEQLRGFFSNGKQGIQYHRGTWHMPLIGFTPGQNFLIVDSNDKQPNCDEIVLSEPVTIPATAQRWLGAE